MLLVHYFVYCIHDLLELHGRILTIHAANCSSACHYSIHTDDDNDVVITHIIT